MLAMDKSPYAQTVEVLVASCTALNWAASVSVAQSEASEFSIHCGKLSQRDTIAQRKEADTRTWLEKQSPMYW